APPSPAPPLPPRCARPPLPSPPRRSAFAPPLPCALPRTFPLSPVTPPICSSASAPLPPPTPPLRSLLTGDERSNGGVRCCGGARRGAAAQTEPKSKFLDSCGGSPLRLYRWESQEGDEPHNLALEPDQEALAELKGVGLQLAVLVSGEGSILATGNLGASG
ncbi:unnamed protein product, partial [Urochloa humidicola]